MKKPIYSFIFIMLISCPALVFGQVGIDTRFPRQALSVNGIIQSTSDGFQFPDGSVQHKAAPESVPGSAADARYILVMEAHGIDGSFNNLGYQDAMRVYNFEWGVYHNLVPDSLLFAGPRIHKILTITKDIDKGSVPLIQKAIESSEIPDVTIYFWYYGLGGQPQAYYEIVLNAVKVVRFDQVVEHKDDGTSDYAHMERISFSFETIEWEYYDGGIQYFDNLMGSGPSDIFGP